MWLFFQSQFDKDQKKKKKKSMEAEEWARWQSMCALGGLNSSQLLVCLIYLILG